MPMPTSTMASLTSISSPQTEQRERYSSGGGPKGSSLPSGGGGSGFLRRILPPPHRFQFVVDHARGRVPYPPQPHVALTMRTASGVAPRALLVPLAVGHRGDDLDRLLHEALYFRQGGLNHALQLGQRLGRLHAVRAHPLETFRKGMWHHAPDKRVDRYMPLRKVSNGFAMTA